MSPIVSIASPTTTSRDCRPKTARFACSVCSARPACSTCSAFTLIELLVVISIIAVLIGTLLPSLGKARDAARTTQSISNNHQISMGLFEYATDNQQLFPATGHTGMSWMEHIGLPGFQTTNDFATPAAFTSYLAELQTVTPYIQNAQVFRSPNDNYQYWSVPDANSDMRHTSYGFNAYFSTDHPPYFGVGADTTVSPASTIITIEYNSLGDWEDHTTPQWFGYNPSSGEPQSTASGFVPVNDMPYPNLTFYNEAIGAGATPGPSSNPPTAPTIDFTGDASDAWDPIKFQANSQALGFYNGSDVYGFVDGHAALVPFASTFSWPTYSPTAWTAPAINWYDPKAAK